MALHFVKINQPGDTSEMMIYQLYKSFRMIMSGVGAVTPCGNVYYAHSQKLAKFFQAIKLPNRRCFSPIYAFFTHVLLRLVIPDV